jgi:general secretion pathway protein G
MNARDRILSERNPAVARIIAMTHAIERALIYGAGAVAAIALLGAIIVLNTPAHGVRSKPLKMRADLKVLSSLLNVYHDDTGRYPLTLVELCATSGDGPYVKDPRMLLDPWKRPYVYNLGGADGAPYTLGTYGADGIPGGAGEDADQFFSP